MRSRTYKDTNYCGICGKDTMQEIHDSGHERDSSGDSQRCLECGAYYSGLTGEWQEDEAFKIPSKEEREVYDSTQDTLDHINSVKRKMFTSAKELELRGMEHDLSKLHSPEKELFDEMTPILKTLEYGSPEYKKSLEKLGPALQHHYLKNSHHPEHHPRGVEGMNLFDLVEMFCDWMAATERTKDGDIRKSIMYNKTRFGMCDQLAEIFLNTLKHYGV